MKRCHLCMTRFSVEDFEIHIAAHKLDPWIEKQWVAQRQFSNASRRHAPNEGCNCSYYGVRSVCEVTRLEAA